MEAYFPIPTVARAMNKSVEAVESELTKGSFHSVMIGGEAQLPAHEMSRMGSRLHLSHTENLSQRELDRILDKYITPWAMLS